MIHKKVQKGPFKYSCEKCDYYTNKKSQYNRHLKTKKHNDTNDTLYDTKKRSFRCECGKTYKYHTGLSRHKKTCTHIHQKTVVEPETIETPTQTTSKSMEQMFMALMEKNQELQEQLIELASKPRNVTNNNTFNLNNFLNIDCKDAMNLSDFMESIMLASKGLHYIENNTQTEK